MFREKLRANSDERGYLYIRETVYTRDGRTLKRIPRKLGNGEATKNRGKYSKKVDIYCGRIIEKQLIHFINFSDWVEKKGIDFTIFKLNSDFNEILDEFINYVLYIYDIDYLEFYESETKKVFALGNGFISPIVISWLKRFNINGNPNNLSELKRFAYRCQDCCIFDDEIVHLLYLKMVPEVFSADIAEEIKNMRFAKMFDEKEKFNGLKSFLKEKN